MQEVTKAEFRRSEEEPWQPLEVISGLRFVPEGFQLSDEQLAQWAESLAKLGEMMRSIGVSVGPLRFEDEDFHAFTPYQPRSRSKKPLTQREKAERNRRKMAKASRKANRR